MITVEVHESGYGFVQDDKQLGMFSSDMGPVFHAIAEEKLRRIQAIMLDHAQGEDKQLRQIWEVLFDRTAVKRVDCSTEEGA